MRSLFPDLKAVRRVVNLCSPAGNNISVCPLAAPAAINLLFSRVLDATTVFVLCLSPSLTRAEEMCQGIKTKDLLELFLHPFVASWFVSPWRGGVKWKVSLGRGGDTQVCRGGQMEPQTWG